MKQLLLDIKPPASPTLENFLPGRNIELLQKLENIVLRQDQERFVYLWGGLGCGKSHLLRAVVGAYLKKNLNAVYFSCQNQPEFFLGEDVDCVAIDDVSHLDTSAQVRLFGLYNQLRDKGRTFFLASGSVAAAQLPMRQDLVTRLGWGLVYQIHELTDEEKMQAMKSHAAECGFDLSPEICHYLLSHGRRDLPSLMTTLDALDRYALVNKRRITVPLLRELLQGVS